MLRHYILSKLIGVKMFYKITGVLLIFVLLSCSNTIENVNTQDKNQFSVNAKVKKDIYIYCKRRNNGGYKFQIKTGWRNKRVKLSLTWLKEDGKSPIGLVVERGYTYDKHRWIEHAPKGAEYAFVTVTCKKRKKNEVTGYGKRLIKLP